MMATGSPPQPEAVPAKPKASDFYVGYSKRLPADLRVFLPIVALLLVALFVASGLLLGLAQPHPGEGRFRWDLGPQTLVGTLEMHPVPIVHAQPTARFPAGHTMMLTGQGKVGVQAVASALDGKLVEVKGFITERGALDMLVVDTLRAADAGMGEAGLPPVVDLGRWRLTGEICDGKCVSGAMRPGRGASHKACANLCILGGAPPVLVANGAIEGRSFFLLADEAGQPVADRLLDATAVPVEVEGRVERRGDLLVLRLDLKSVKRL
ncbi:MAG: hypothetical protein NW217_06020 [Hyphomicrobiaceae bacterium]|nr:hypothetical protein [Hyphomicrobiaceae bacterium]